MTSASARVSDKAICPIHGTTTIMLGSPNVITNKLFQARATDVCICTGAVPNKVTKGSSTVRTNFLPTAHVGLVMEHAAILPGGSPNVFIGGPDGSLAGPVAAAKAACAALAGTRASGSSRQSYGNCGIETMRQLINAERARQGLPPMTEEEALAAGQAAGADTSANPHERGGITLEQEQEMMERMGYPVSVVQGMTQEQLAQAVESGTPVGISSHCRYFWPPGVGDSDMHEVLVTGVERDADGNIVGFYINDTGMGQCGRFVPAAALNRARKSDSGGYLPVVVPKSKPF